MWRAVQGRRFTEFSWHCSSFFFFSFLLFEAFVFFHLLPQFVSFLPRFFFSFFDFVFGLECFRCQLCCVRSRQQKSEESVIILKHTLSRHTFTRFSFSPALLRRFTRKISFATTALFADVDRCYPFAEHEKICDAPFTEDCLYLGIRGIVLHKWKEENDGAAETRECN